MFSKINKYILTEIFKSFALIFFIFLTISWLLQITRLLTVTNFLQVDIIDIVYLSIFLIPNLLSIILPFIIIFGMLLSFLKLNKNKELIALFSLGFNLTPLKYTLSITSIIILGIYTSLNFYYSPKIYEKFKIKEFEIRNTIDFDKMIKSNFMRVNDETTLDFKKNDKIYEEIFINFYEDGENFIYAKNGLIIKESDKYKFQLNDGFKISILNENKIEKLEFENYMLEITNKYKNIEFNNYDKNTLTIFNDLENRNYLNISFKIADVILVIIIIIFFYFNNIKVINFNLFNNILFVITSSILLITNQILKNFDLTISTYLFFLIFLILLTIFILKIKKI